jgi:hypothetical protein
VTAPLSRRLNVVAAAHAQGVQSLSVAKGRTLQMTDIVLENPQGDFGSLTISRGQNVLLVLALENFRDIDYHFVSPIVISGGQSLGVNVRCARVGKPVGSTPTRCDTSVLVGGTEIRPK